MRQLFKGISQRHKEYKSRGLYTYIRSNLIKIIAAYSVFILIMFLAGEYIFDLKAITAWFIDSFPTYIVLLIFLVSESFLGLIPVDLFVFWSLKHPNPTFYLGILGLISYTGGIISYGIGKWLSQRPGIKEYSERKLSSYINFTQKWGGAFIIVAALFPFTPFSMVVIAVSLLKYPFGRFLIFALSRLLRFIIQGIIFFDLLNIDSWML